MVVRIKQGTSMKGALNYNEDKVQRGVAELIAASGFACDIDELGFSQKLKRFNALIQNSSKVSYNTVHLSLNFAPGEELDTQTLQRIARDYMSRIGFAGQPFLVYRHDDTAHPHIHIVTTPILRNGRSINIHNLAKRKSEPARKEIELEYGLVIAESRKKDQIISLQPISLEAVNYSHSETKKSISNIVREVVARYKFTTLDELNVILRQYNITADRGGINSRMYQRGGLIYSCVDKNGYKTGVPIKASTIFGNPTLGVLENKFHRNISLKTVFKEIVQSKIFDVFLKSKSTSEFMDSLKRRNIGCSVQYNFNGTIQNISFVDHFTKSVFSSDDLGISIRTLLDQLKVTSSNRVNKNHEQSGTFSVEHTPTNRVYNPESIDFVKILLTSEFHQPDLSTEFLKKRKKKRKR